MATGSYDANGIWNYGEDDNIALFSDTLNMLAESTSDAFTDDRNRLSTLEAGSLSGLVPVNSGTATVAGAGSTISANELGTITFGTATSLTLDGIFTSDYTDYKIFVNFGGSATTFNVTSQLRASNSSLSAASYNWAHTYASLGTSLALESAANVTAMTHFVSALGAGVNVLEYTISQPGNAGTRTQIAGVAMRSRNSGIISADYTVSTAADGFTLVPSTGNFTGTLTVYGFNR